MQKTMPPIKSFICQTFVSVMMFSVIGLTQAETVYVNDQLRVGVRPEPNNSAAPLAVVTTGDKMELLDRDSGYVMVRTKEGIEGWIKEIYTTADVPAIVQLQSLSQTAGGSNKKIRELTKQVGIMQSANQALSSELEQAKDANSKIQMQLLGIKNERPSSRWVYWLSGMLIFAIISFILGVYWYRNQAMKRLGGLRIYF